MTTELKNTKANQVSSGLITSALLSTCAAFFIGVIMNCKHKTCPLLEIRLIKLTRGLYAIVDRSMYEWLSQWKWCAHKSIRYVSFYAVRSSRRSDGPKHRTIRMHREIMGLALYDGKFLDHRNHNTLDNRKSNLRICTPAENCRNSINRSDNASGYKGVSWNSKRKKWYVFIDIEKK